MSRRRRGHALCAVLLLDKPRGLSSNHALQQARRLCGAAKAGHGGSLDPLAEGVLPLLFGDATRLSDRALNGDKAYRFGMAFGRQTSTGDLDGETVRECAQPAPDAAALRAVLPRFLGPQQQLPPMYSALKRDGQPLYKLARQGIEVERAPRDITVHALELESVEGEVAYLHARVSKGTYIRTLAEDIAAALAHCAHLVYLRRTECAGLRAPLCTLDALAAMPPQQRLRQLLPASVLAPQWPCATLDAEQAGRFAHGQPLPWEGEAASAVWVRDSHGRLLGIAEAEPRRLLPQRVFAAQAWQPGQPLEGLDFSSAAQ